VTRGFKKKPYGKHPTRGGACGDSAVGFRAEGSGTQHVKREAKKLNRPIKTFQGGFGPGGLFPQSLGAGGPNKWAAGGQGAGGVGAVCQRDWARGGGGHKPVSGKNGLWGSERKRAFKAGSGPTVEGGGGPPSGPKRGGGGGERPSVGKAHRAICALFWMGPYRDILGAYFSHPQRIFGAGGPTKKPGGNGMGTEPNLSAPAPLRRASRVIGSTQPASLRWALHRNQKRDEASPWEKRGHAGFSKKAALGGRTLGRGPFGITDPTFSPLAKINCNPPWGGGGGTA